MGFGRSNRYASWWSHTVHPGLMRGRRHRPACRGRTDEEWFGYLDSPLWLSVGITRYSVCLYPGLLVLSRWFSPSWSRNSRGRNNRTSSYTSLKARYLAHAYIDCFLPGGHEQHGLALEVLHILIAEGFAVVMLKDLEAIGGLQLSIIEWLEAHAATNP